MQRRTWVDREHRAEPCGAEVALGELRDQRRWCPRGQLDGRWQIAVDVEALEGVQRVGIELAQRDAHRSVDEPSGTHGDQCTVEHHQRIGRWRGLDAAQSMDDLHRRHGCAGLEPADQGHVDIHGSARYATHRWVSTSAQPCVHGGRVATPRGRTSWVLSATRTGEIAAFATARERLDSGFL